MLRVYIPGPLGNQKFLVDQKFLVFSGKPKIWAKNQKIFGGFLFEKNLFFFDVFFEIFRIYENLWNFRFSVEFRMKFSVFRSVFVEYSFSGFLVSMFCLGTDYIYI